MELRSGRIVKYNPYTRRDIRNLAKTLSQLSLADEEEYKIVEEAKILFRFIFYHTCKYFANNCRLEEIEISNGRKPNVDEILKWNADEDFWKKMFKKGWETMQEEATPAALLRSFFYFVKNDHPDMLGKPESFSRMKAEITRYLEKLYGQNSCERMLEYMEEQFQVIACIGNTTAKTLYFREIANYLALNFTNSSKKFPDREGLEKLFQHVKDSTCYISDDRCTVKRSNYVVFSNPPTYLFTILDPTMLFKHFSSSEKDPRALLLQKRLQGQ